MPEFLDEEHGLHAKFENVRGSVHGACQFCANAFHVRKEIEDSDVPLLDERNRHPDLHALVADGYETITF